MRLVDFPHKHLLTTHEQLYERFFDPAEGVALVETGVDAHSLVAAVATKETVLRGEEFLTEGVFFYLGDDGLSANQMGYQPTKPVGSIFNVMTERFVSIVDIDEIEKIKEASEIVKAIVQPDVDLETKTYHRRLQMNMSRRARGGEFGHSDPSFATVWFGASNSRLRIGDWESGIGIDDVPTGYALIWRGDRAMGDDLATKHAVFYRGKESRVSLLS